MNHPCLCTICLNARNNELKRLVQKICESLEGKVKSQDRNLVWDAALDYAITKIRKEWGV